MAAGTSCIGSFEFDFSILINFPFAMSPFYRFYIKNINMFIESPGEK